MHTEHLQNVRPSWVAFGWFAAAAVTGFALVVLISIGLLHPSSTEGGGGWVLLCVAVGFFAGGWLTGWRTASAPILHGVGIGLFSLVVWLGVNLLSGALGASDWSSLTPTLAAAVLLLQIAAAGAGAWYGTHHHAVNTAVED